MVLPTLHVFDSTQVLDSTEVVEDVLEARYPRLAKTYFEWVHIYYAAFMSPECYFGIEAEVFPEADEDTA